MSSRSSPRSGLGVVGAIGVALCCVLPALAGLGALSGVALVLGLLAAVVATGALVVAVALRRLTSAPRKDG